MYLFGINSVYECLLVKRVKEVFLANSFNDKKTLDEIYKQHIKVNYVDKNKLDSLSKGGVHQGIVALAKALTPISLNEALSKVKNKENPVFVMLDGLKDPHNLGAIIRTSDIFGISGVIYKKHDSVTLNETVEKVSTGATNYVPCIEVTNLTNSINDLKKEGYWVVGLEGDSKQDIKDMPKDCKLVIVIGSEGKGISRLVKENCDLLVKINMSGHGHINSLNASNAAAIALYELRRK